MKATTREAYRLMHDGALALSRVESNGIRIDVDRLDGTISKVERRIENLTNKLRDSEEWKTWKEMHGQKAKLSGRQQLASVLQRMGHRWTEKTEKGNVKMDQRVLEEMDDPFVESYLEIEKLKKILGTNLKGIRREVVDGFIHPSFNLHLVKTYRSSSDSPNFQNLPIRDKLSGKLVRTCFVPRKDHVLVEIDFSGLEVRIAACFHKDPVMIEYIETGYDMHREMAAELYKIDPEDVTKEMRYCAKNMFVFPQFYGSWFGDCAPNLWKAIDKYDMEVGAVPLKGWLEDKGIGLLGRPVSRWGTGRTNGETGRIETESGTFVDHVRGVEELLWKRFDVYARWKEDWHRKYLQRGWFDLLTGFRESGVYKRNDVINHPVQGSAFHCLLWCLIELVKWTERSRMKSKVVGQIHDSIVADVHRSELDDYVEKARELMTKKIREAWDWIIVPLDVDVEVGEKNWFEKKELAV